MAAVCLLSTTAGAQDWLTVGVKGGFPLTGAFKDRTYQQTITVVNPSVPTPAITIPIRTYSDSKNFLIGPTIEVRLPLGFAVEADALYRPLSLSVLTGTAPGFGGFLLGTPASSSHYASWEFPVLAKYRFPLPFLKPYLEAGPSFRAISSRFPQHLSDKGVTAGIGVEAKLPHFSLAPELRYTHWGSDSGYPTSAFHPVSNQNQLEFLIGLAPSHGNNAIHAITAPAGFFGHLVSFGIKGGVPFTDSFAFDRVSIVTFPSVRTGDFSSGSGAFLTAGPTITTYNASKTYLLGPTVELHLPLGLSLEADALYHPLNFLTPPALLRPNLVTTATKHENDSWEFPVLGKYRFPIPFVSPYLEAGPTFRTLSSPLSQYLSNVGVAAGVGVEARVWKLRLSPEVRFIHWGKDSGAAYPFYSSRRNQAQFLIGLSY